MQKKKMAFWGCGCVCRAIIENYGDIIPDFFIDRDKSKKEYCNKPIIQPEQIQNWKDIFVVITVLNPAEIVEELEQKGLCEKEDFVKYHDYLHIENHKSVELIRRLQKDKMKYLHCSLFVGVFFHLRQNKIVTNFLSRYMKEHSEKNFLVLSSLGYLDDLRASEILGCPVLEKAKICDYQGYHGKDYWEERQKVPLNAEEKDWIDYVHQIKGNTDEDERIRWETSAQIYHYLKEIMDVLQPRSIVIWGAWVYSAYHCRYLANQRKIPFGILEYGWLPGTIQFNPMGIAGEGYWCRKKGNISNLASPPKEGVILPVKELIRGKRLDTGIFGVVEEEEKAVGERNPAHKTVFLVGMDDYGINLNHQSECWKEVMSHSVGSTKELYQILQKICVENHWNMIFKPHPSSTGSNDFTKDMEGVIQVNRMSIDKLIEISDVVVSIESAVNYKVLLYDKPLVQLGITSLTYADCCYQVDRIEDLEDTLKKALEFGLTEKQKQNYRTHMEYQLANFLWDDLSERELRYGLPVTEDFFEVAGRYMKDAEVSEIK